MGRLRSSGHSLPASCLPLGDGSRHDVTEKHNAHRNVIKRWQAPQAEAAGICRISPHRLRNQAFLAALPITKAMCPQVFETLKALHCPREGLFLCADVAWSIVRKSGPGFH